MEPLLKVEGLTIDFKTEKGQFSVVNDVSFEIHDGEIIGLVGESGCGKSVTSLSIMGLLPRKISGISNGKILYKGKDLTKATSKELRKLRGKEISMIFQEPMTSLNPVFTIGDQIGQVIKNHTNLSKKEIKERSIELLTRVGIPRDSSIINEYPHQLSGGMRQRVMIAMAIACNPKLLIADEPTTALDVTIQAQILELLKNLAKEKNMSVIFITHDLGVVAEMCDRVIVMYSSQIVEQADVREFFKNPKHPYSKGLLSSIPKIGMGDEPLSYIQGNVPHPSEVPKGCRFQSRCPAAFDKCIEDSPSLFNVGENHLSRCWLHQEEVNLYAIRS
jgi:peptide/nickel transport system ATP-binding protein